MFFYFCKNFKLNNICLSFTFQLSLPLGTIKACVLIESIFCSFELDQILYELRQHSAGLNCGMWDYSASLVSNFGMYNNIIRHERQLFFDYPVFKKTTVLLDVEMWNTENVTEKTFWCSGKLFFQLELLVLFFILSFVKWSQLLACTAGDVISLKGQGQL